MGIFRWLICTLFGIAWTIALIVPMPEPVRIPNGGRPFLAKSVHIVAYATFAILAGWLRVPPRYRWLLAAFLMAHGTATEVLQDQFTNRSGQLLDVGLDNLAVALGMLCSWKWWVE